jgi:hypothetical protein
VARHGTQKTDNGEIKNMNAPTNNNEPEDGAHINEEGTAMDTDPECSTQADPSLPIVQEQDTLNTDTDNRCKMEQADPSLPIVMEQDTMNTDTDNRCNMEQADPSLPIVQEQDTLNTDTDNRCNMEQPGTTGTEIQDSRNEEEEKYCDEQYTGPKPQQHENPKPTTTKLANGNKTTERVNTNRVDKTNNDIIQNLQCGIEDMQDVCKNPQRPKKLKLEGNGEPSAERKRSRTRNETSKRDK